MTVSALHAGADAAFGQSCSLDMADIRVIVLQWR